MKEHTANLNSIKTKKYTICEKYFTIYPTQEEGRGDHSFPGDVLACRDKIISYSSTGSNKIVEVYEITDQYIKTKNYADFYPLFITKYNKSLYSEDEIRTQTSVYKKLLADHDKLKNLFWQIKAEYIAFEKATGLTFVDKAPNNILVNHDCSDFRIIDIASIQRFVGSSLPKFPRSATVMALRPDAARREMLQSKFFPNKELGYDEEMVQLIQGVDWDELDDDSGAKD